MPGIVVPSASFTSDLQLVMSWDRDHCGTVNNSRLPPMPSPHCVSASARGCDDDNIDSMPRVWFDATAGVYRQLHNVATIQGPSRPQVGASLETLRHTCKPYAKMQLGTDFTVLNHFNDHVWVEAPYVLNDTHVYAITHVDSYVYNMTINPPKKALLHSSYSSLTLQKSTDGGASFAQALPAPLHVVGTSPYDNRDNQLGRGLGLGMPSSILRDPKSDYLYMMALANWGTNTTTAQAAGQCLLRTRDITDPASWRAWNGTGSHFTVSVNASPVIAPVPDPDAHTCAVLDLPLTHISPLWSSFYGKYLAFGETHAKWGFALSDDLTTWSAVTEMDSEAFPWKMPGNATVTPVSPMPGRWVFAPEGNDPRSGVPYWVGAQNATGEAASSGEVFKWKAFCSQCSEGPCEPCPGMGDVCKLAKPISATEWAALPFSTTSVDFSCALVSKLAGYTNYLYPTLVDDSEHKRTGSDPSLNVVGQTATVFFVANTCSGTLRQSADTLATAGVRLGSNTIKCSEHDAVHRLRRDVVRATIKFGTI